MKEFSDWLSKEMDERNLGASQLASLAHVTRGAIGNVLRENRDPGPELCTALAKAFKIPPEVLFRKAGLLPALPGLNEKIEEIKEIAFHLSDDELNELLMQARLRMKIHNDRT